MEVVGPNLQSGELVAAVGLPRHALSGLFRGQREGAHARCRLPPPEVLGYHQHVTAGDTTAQRCCAPGIAARQGGGDVGTPVPP